jgi:hypothetical protein
MKGIIAMKDNDQRFVVQAVNFSKAVRVRLITRIARLRNSYFVAIDPERTRPVPIQAIEAMTATLHRA